jgi:hypothetical protein
MKTLLAEICVSFGLLVVMPGAMAQSSDSETGFRTLFDGEHWSGWEGDDRFWSIQDGVIVGQTTKQNPAPHNTFLIFRDAEFGDFELRFRYRVEGYNSGIQYRSTAADDFKVSGYQADFEAQWHDGGIDKFSGMFFEEGGRMFMGQRGDAVVVRNPAPGQNKPVIEKVGSVGDPSELARAIKRDDWNDYTIIARGFTFLHLINGTVMSVAIDEDTDNRRESGVLAFQLHSGRPMKIEVKDLRIREF